MRALVVVDHGNREHAAAGIAQHAANHGGSGILAADDGHPDAHATVRSLPAEKARMEAQESDPEEREGAPERDDLERHPGQVHLEPDGIERQQHGQGDETGHGDVAGLFDAGVAPDPAVQTKHAIGAQLHYQCN